MVHGFPVGFSHGSTCEGSEEGGERSGDGHSTSFYWQGCCWLVSPSMRLSLSSGSKLLSPNIQVWASPTLYTSMDP